MIKNVSFKGNPTIVIEEQVYLTHWIPLHNINCAHSGIGPLLKFNGIVYKSRPVLLVPVLWTIVLLTNISGSGCVWVKSDLIKISILGTGLNLTCSESVFQFAQTVDSVVRQLRYIPVYIR